MWLIGCSMDETSDEKGTLDIKKKKEQEERVEVSIVIHLMKYDFQKK